MKQSEIAIGKTYLARISGIVKEVIVVARIAPGERRYQESTHFRLRLPGEGVMLLKTVPAKALKHAGCYVIQRQTRPNEWRDSYDISGFDDRYDAEMAAKRITDWSGVRCRIRSREDSE